ncbi:glycosyltransferase family 39 protein [Patescibacteria group bacterium]|nr:glycosyltransferase family 39 protein [Patescibacteria group bacterium]
MRRNKLFLLILFFVTVSLRLINLEYSDYIQDEVTTFLYRDDQILIHFSPREYLSNQHKGPLQVLVARIPYTIVGNYDNELALRIPFSLFSIASVFVFYYMVLRLSKNENIAFFSAFLFSVSGLVVAYGRIAQYQSLVFFFGFSSIYYFASLLEDSLTKNRIITNTLLGTFLFSIAFYGHWFVVFMLFPILYILITFLKKKEFSLKFMIFIALVNLVLLLALLLPYFVPYFLRLFENSRNVAYAEHTFGVGSSFFVRKDVKQFLLYNPFLTLPLYLSFGAFGIYLSRKFKIFSIWFLLTLLIFRFFVNYSGLHFYHIFIPLIILVAYTYNYLITHENPRVKKYSRIFLVLSFAFLYFQSYLIFVDHRKEYPMEQEKILIFKTPEITHEDRLRSKTGFPHKRYWEEINDFVNSQNLDKGFEYGYYTNEDKGIARIYMDTEVVTGENFYGVGIKRPYSLATDYKFPQYKNRSTIHKIKNEYGDTVVTIYWIGEQE